MLRIVAQTSVCCLLFESLWNLKFNVNMLRKNVSSGMKINILSCSFWAIWPLMLYWVCAEVSLQKVNIVHDGELSSCMNAFTFCTRLLLSSTLGRDGSRSGLGRGTPSPSRLSGEVASLVCCLVYLFIYIFEISSYDIIEE